MSSCHNVNKLSIVRKRAERKSQNKDFVAEVPMRSGSENEGGPKRGVGSCKTRKTWYNRGVAARPRLRRERAASRDYRRIALGARSPGAFLLSKGVRAVAKTHAIQHRKKRAFLAAYARLGNVTQAATAAGIDRSTHYAWLREEGPEGDAYRAAFAQAEEEAADWLEAEARRRAVEGVEEPVYQGGKKVGTVRRYSDTLLIFLLKGARPDKYADRHKAELTGANGAPFYVVVGEGLPSDVYGTGEDHQDQ